MLDILKKYEYKYNILINQWKFQSESLDIFP